MRRILVVRTDNIGDLVCTTPMLHLLRQEFPDDWIGVLANSYNVAVLKNNPDIDEVFAYRKAKHREHGESRLSVWLETAGLMWNLRRRKIDVAIVASPSGERHVRMAGCRQVITGQPAGRMHEVERTAALLAELGIGKAPGPLRMVADDGLAARLAATRNIPEASGPRVAVHISARRPKQRWPIEAFASLIASLVEAGSASQVLLFWSPGSQDSPTHPGDDEKLAQLMGMLPGLPVFPFRTETLDELISGLSLCDSVICSDGGAMHIAAALGKPMVCLFGDSDIGRWHPWGVHHEVLCPDSRDVGDISPAEVAGAFRRVMESSCRPERD